MNSFLHSNLFDSSRWHTLRIITGTRGLSFSVIRVQSCDSNAFEYHIMSVSVEALAMAGVDYNEWGMDIEEWERMETGPPPPHLYADDYDQEHKHERDEEVIMMKTYATDELCGCTEPENQLTDVFNERNNKEGDDDFLMQSPKTYNKIMNRGHGMKRLKILVIVMMVIRFLRRQIL
ncbi:hypothetical protein L1987_33846 [Smallanthus sonchifolius]|uniref:Uncharacterized protein n=1 Tax=Smallanthus sonchifolius TaxID=185202 RepID=A0ACB9HRZ5_9ASTR|nr:hypothetical protein L1987_33846 [Smallanthus sonchifolius]